MHQTKVHRCFRLGHQTQAVDLGVEPHEASVDDRIPEDRLLLLGPSVWVG